MFYKLCVVVFCVLFFVILVRLKLVYIMLWAKVSWVRLRYFLLHHLYGLLFNRAIIGILFFGFIVCIQVFVFLFFFHSHLSVFYSHAKRVFTFVNQFSFRRMFGLRDIGFFWTKVSLDTVPDETLAIIDDFELLPNVIKNIFFLLFLAFIVYIFRAIRRYLTKQDES